MYCPNCKDEYVDGIEKCAVCGAVLVYSLEETNDTAQNPMLDIINQYEDITEPCMITINKSVEEAYLIKGYLNSEDIPCEILDDASVQVYGVRGRFCLIINSHDLEEITRRFNDMSVEIVTVDHVDDVSGEEK